ncbi:MAG TPA: gfo/Idh/MocA family oxidoreductase, partial [Pirellulaceae bacterium]|nr:gfo/Idh/MocA family oxidoreductase [Pirellulaceae bacterium]
AQWGLYKKELGDGPIDIDGADSKRPVEFRDGFPVADDSYNTSHDFAVHCKFADGVVMTISSRSENGILFEGTKGRIFVNRGKITGKPIEENWDADHFGPDELVELYKGKPFEGHKSNFYRTIAEGGLPISDVYSHLQVMNTCHLAAIAARLGRTIRWDPQSETIIGDDLAATFAARQPTPGFEYLRD